MKRTYYLALTNDGIQDFKSGYFKTKKIILALDVVDAILQCDIENGDIVIGVQVDSGIRLTKVKRLADGMPYEHTFKSNLFDYGYLKIEKIFTPKEMLDLLPEEENVFVEETRESLYSIIYGKRQEFKWI